MQREFFPVVKKTILPRPVERVETDVLGQRGTVWATEAMIYGPNWHHDTEQNLIEAWDAGPALVFRDILPKKSKYEKENLYLRLSIAYRTTENASANIRTFSGNHVTLPNAVQGAMYEDPYTFHWVTDDLTLNINTVFRGEKLWIQRVEWEWMSREVIYEDELGVKAPYLARTRDAVESAYVEPEVNAAVARAYLLERIDQDEHFAKRCLALLNADRLLQKDFVELYRDLGVPPRRRTPEA